MRKLVIALAGAAALTIASAAQASVTIDSTDMAAAAVNGPDTSGDFSIAFFNFTPEGSFTDTLQFTNDLDGLYNLSVLTQLGNLFVESLSCEGCGIWITGPDGTQQFGAPSFNGVAYTYSLGNVDLGVGQYTLTLVGDSPSLGTYVGTVNFSAVPEPAAWAMMLVGFGAIGASMRRRRTRVATPQLA